MISKESILYLKTFMEEIKMENLKLIFEQKILTGKLADAFSIPSGAKAKDPVVRITVDQLKSDVASVSFSRDGVAYGIFNMAAHVENGIIPKEGLAVTVGKVIETAVTALIALTDEKIGFEFQENVINVTAGNASIPVPLSSDKINDFSFNPKEVCYTLEIDAKEFKDGVAKYGVLAEPECPVAISLRCSQDEGIDSLQILSTGSNLSAIVGGHVPVNKADIIKKDFDTSTIVCIQASILTRIANIIGEGVIALSLEEDMKRILIINKTGIILCIPLMVFQFSPAIRNMLFNDDPKNYRSLIKVNRVNFIAGIRAAMVESKAVAKDGNKNCIRIVINNDGLMVSGINSKAYIPIEADVSGMTSESVAYDAVYFLKELTAFTAESIVFRSRKNTSKNSDPKLLGAKLQEVEDTVDGILILPVVIQK